MAVTTRETQILKGLFNGEWCFGCSTRVRHRAASQPILAVNRLLWRLRNTSEDFQPEDFCPIDGNLEQEGTTMAEYSSQDLQLVLADEAFAGQVIVSLVSYLEFALELDAELEELVERWARYAAPAAGREAAAARK